MASSSGKSGWLIGIVILLIIGAFGVYAATRAPAPGTGEQIACTDEAKLCPDGSSVGRTGPNCAFAPCPGSTVTEPETLVKTYIDAKTGVSFQYPAKLSTTYISLVEEAPTVAVTGGPMTCKASGSEITPAGSTELKTIDGKAYCVTTKSEGAAGSTYTEYTYATEKEGKVVAVTFTLRAVQCANYDEPQQTACEAERANFSLDGMVAQIASSLTFTK
jgi:hypothetical protein